MKLREETRAGSSSKWSYLGTAGDAVWSQPQWLSLASETRSIDVIYAIYVINMHKNWNVWHTSLSIFLKTILTALGHTWERRKGWERPSWIPWIAGKKLHSKLYHKFTIVMQFKFAISIQTLRMFLKLICHALCIEYLVDLSWDLPCLRLKHKLIQTFLVNKVNL